jgi:hypothetical protein
MMRTLVATIILIGVGLVMFMPGCRPKHAPPTPGPDSGLQLPQQPATQTSTPTTRPFAGPGLQLAYSSDWQPTASGDADYALMLVPRENVNGSDVSLSVEIPKLPPHIPGMIPLGSVVKGYIDDVKKQHPGVHVEPPVATKLAGANARRVTSTWTDSGKGLSEEAVLTVRSDRVYIFRANADEPNRQRAAHALDELLGSVQWR